MVMSSTHWPVRRHSLCRTAQDREVASFRGPGSSRHDLRLVGIGGREPQWRLSAEMPDRAGWTNLNIKTFRFPGHPQETTENAVDLAHLRYVHGYGNVDRVEQVSVDGHRLESRFDFGRVRKIAKIATLTFDLSATTGIFGLGYSYVEIHERSIGMDIRLWILATPVDGKLIDLSHGLAGERDTQPEAADCRLGISPDATRRAQHE